MFLLSYLFKGRLDIGKAGKNRPGVQTKYWMDTPGMNLDWRISPYPIKPQKSRIGIRARDNVGNKSVAARARDISDLPPPGTPGG